MQTRRASLHDIDIQGGEHLAQVTRAPTQLALRVIYPSSTGSILQHYGEVFTSQHLKILATFNHTKASMSYCATRQRI